MFTLSTHAVLLDLAVAVCSCSSLPILVLLIATVQLKCMNFLVIASAVVVIY